MLVIWHLRRQGDVDAQVGLGNLYIHGHGVPQSFERAVELYKQGAAQGNDIAQNNLGVFNEYGYGVTQDYQEARRLYALASAQGCASATKALQRVEEVIRSDPRQALTKPRAKKPKPNAPCSCGSGKKYKKCCGAHSKS